MPALPHPWLVQRLRVRSPESADKLEGVDRYFSFDYMGSAEFEFGALNISLKRIRQQTGVGAWGVCREFIFVGPKARLPICRALILDELGPKTHQLKEPTGIRHPEGFEDTVGWWCIEEGMDFAFFRKNEHATQWFDGLREKR